MPIGGLVGKVAGQAIRSATDGLVQNGMARVGLGSPQANLAHNMNRQVRQNALAGMPGAPPYQPPGRRSALEGVQFQNDEMTNMATMDVPAGNQQPPHSPRRVPPNPEMQPAPSSTAPEGYQDIPLANNLIKRICLNTGAQVHLRGICPAGQQDIELANGRVKRIDLSTGAEVGLF